jgi:PhzF family phenazine biosynthesis protein
MKRIKLYQIDSFTDRLFGGNPAAVCLLDEWLPDQVMQNIGAENNLAETAFLVPKGNDYEIRWFTPGVEVDLCGHATLASGYLAFEHLGFKGGEVVFHSPRSGVLRVKKEQDLFWLDFPTDELKRVESRPEIAAGIGLAPAETYRGKTDYLAVLNAEAEVLNISPDLAAIRKLDGRGLIVSAPGAKVDFVSRFFAPQSGIDEDPVTGSAHTSLIPYWSKKLGRKKLTARQVSKRSGLLQCEDNGPRVRIGGKAVLYLVGEIFVDV